MMADDRRQTRAHPASDAREGGPIAASGLLLGNGGLGPVTARMGRDALARHRGESAGRPQRQRAGPRAWNVPARTKYARKQNNMSLTGTGVGLASFLTDSE